MSPPIRDGSGNDIGAIRLGDGSEISEVRTGAGDVLFSATTIPDSLDYRWTLDENSDPFVDEIGGVNATNNGTTQVTGSQYVNGAARKGDAANSAYISYGSLDPLGSSLPDPLTIAYTLDRTTTADGRVFVGVRDNDGVGFTLGVGTVIGGSANSNSHRPTFSIRDSDGDNEAVSSKKSIESKDRFTIVCRKSSGADTNDMDIVVNADFSKGLTDEYTQGASTSKFSDFRDSNDNPTPVYTHAGNNDGSVLRPTDDVIDDLTIDIGTEWTDQQVTDYDNSFR